MGARRSRREAIFKKSANPSGVSCRGEVLPWVLPEAPPNCRRFLDELYRVCSTTGAGTRGKTARAS
jgi:hypothetical protein